MERREFIKTLGLMAGGLAIVDIIKPVNVQAKKRIRWRMVTSWPQSLDTIHGGAITISKVVRKLTNGYFDIRVYSGGELVPPLKVLDAVEEGSIEVGHTCLFYYIGKSPVFAFPAGMPWGLTTRALTSWLMYGKSKKKIEKFLSDFNIVAFLAGHTTCQMGGWFRKSINSVEDLKGLRMRIPGLGGKVMARLGVSVQVLPGGEIYMALERGAIDATEWCVPYDDVKLGFYKVTKYYYYPGWWEPTTAFHLIINKKHWDKLPVEYKEALKIGAYYATLEMVAKYDFRNPIVLREVIKKGIKLRKFPDDVLRRSFEETEKLYQEFCEKDKLFKDIYQDWNSFRTQEYQWFDTAELTYLNSIVNMLKV